MATRTRVSVPPAREKRGTSPSAHAPHHTAATTAQHHHHRTSPNTSKTNSPTLTHDSTTSSDKHVPNYLKATQSSGTDTVSKEQGKKPLSNDVTHNKPNTTRRKSFDKTPSQLTTHKPHASPNPAPRSSSGVGKTVHTSSRTVPDKNLKAGKEPEKQGGGGSLYGGPVKKKTIYVKKGTASGTSSTTKEKDTITSVEKVENHNKPDFAEPETKNEEHVSSVVEHEEHVALDETNNEKKDDSPDEGVTNIEKTEAENEKDVNIANVESSTVVEKHDKPLDVKTEEQDSEENLQVEETDSKKQEIEDAVNEASVAENHKEEVVEKEEEEEEAAVLNHKEKDGFGSEENELKEKQVAKEEKKEAFKPQVVAAAAQVGKKDSSAVSNDVIEETASKLREQRKNKVKALAGAFETVISLQEHK